MSAEKFVTGSIDDDEEKQACQSYGFHGFHGLLI